MYNSTPLRRNKIRLSCYLYAISSQKPYISNMLPCDANLQVKKKAWIPKIGGPVLILYYALKKTRKTWHKLHWW